MNPRSAESIVRAQSGISGVHVGGQARCILATVPYTCIYPVSQKLCWLWAPMCLIRDVHLHAHAAHAFLVCTDFQYNVYSSAFAASNQLWEAVKASPIAIGCFLDA